MGIGKVTANQYAGAIATGVNRRDKTMDTHIGAVKDLYIDPMAEVLEAQNDRIVYLSNLSSLKYVERVVPDDLDKIAFNEAIVRWDSSASIATVTFSRVAAPTADISVPVNYPISTGVNPKTGVAVNFRTIEEKTMYASAPDNYYNAETEQYELNVAVASVSTGEATAVGAYTINEFRRPLPGFDKVFNKDATTAGRGIETNRELADRYLLQVKGNNIGTPTGMKKWVLDNFRTAEDVYVVYGQNEYLTREQDDAGAVDIWIKGSAPIEVNYTVAYPGVEQLIQTNYQPLVTVKSVTTTGGVQFVEGTDYEVVTGEGEYSYSSRGSDGIKFLAGGSAPTNIGDPVYIVYEYNSLITTLDTYFTQPGQYFIGMDRLFRWAQPKYIEIESNLRVRSGDPDVVRSLARAGILEYVNALKLGDDVEEFDLDSIVSRIYGVDNWTYATLAWQNGTGVSDLVVEPYRYAQLEEADFVINLVS